MGHEGHPLLAEQGLRFLGGQTASQAHEVTNVLNVINELSGLMDDLLAASERGRPPDPSRLRTLTQKIARQVQRGEQIVRSLNLFAHGADRPLTEFDLRETLERIAFIAQRAARLKRARLVTAFPEADSRVEGNLLGFQNAVYLCIEIALESASDDGLITLRYDLHEPGFEVMVQSEETLTLTEESRSRFVLLSQIVSALGGQVLNPRDMQNARRLELYFPRKFPPRERLCRAPEDGHGIRGVGQ